MGTWLAHWRDSGRSGSLRLGRVGVQVQVLAHRSSATGLSRGRAYSLPTGRNGATCHSPTPVLSSWMAHQGPESKYWYTSTVPELPALATAGMTLASQASEGEQQP
jgi:hypothetical protein